MKINFKSIGITLGLVLLAIIVFYLNVGVFISGPVYKYDHTVKEQMKTIEKAYTDIRDLKRHVFHYIIYVGEDDENYVWFNEVGKAIDSRLKNTYDENKVKTIVKRKYDGKDIHISLGYGYKAPVYVVTFNQGELLLDYDTLDEIYYLKKGE